MMLTVTAMRITRMRITLMTTARMLMVTGIVTTMTVLTLMRMDTATTRLKKRRARSQSLGRTRLLSRWTWETQPGSPAPSTIWVRTNDRKSKLKKVRPVTRKRRSFKMTQNTFDRMRRSLLEHLGVSDLVGW